MQYFEQNKLPRMHYAKLIYQAAWEASRLGIEEISVIEFGVARGGGLLSCEFHAREISRIFNIRIDVYGFDNGDKIGLPQTEGNWKNQTYLWSPGFYKMDEVVLRKRLRYAKLVLGEVNETAKNFISIYNPAPIGVMLIDLDYYTSTIPVLQMLEGDSNYFLPRVQMYFDDIHPEWECVGETLAIKEFNARHCGKIAISPESGGRKLKSCHVFGHSKYSTLLYEEDALPP